MKNIMTIVVLTLIAFLFYTLVIFEDMNAIRAQAQSANPWQVSVVGAHTLCTVTPATTQYCFASDGLWMSLNGAAYVQLGAVAPVGVVSVNGKTGVVVLGATTTVQ
jgi:hypothetical protein